MFYYLAPALSFLALAGSAAAEIPPALEKKNQRQFRHFEKVQKVLVLGQMANGKSVKRSDWEKCINGTHPKCEPADGNGSIRFTSKDLETLARDQQARYAKEQKSVAKLPGFDFRRMHKDKLLARFCKEIPKGAILHEHPWGTLEPKTVREMLEKIDPTIRPKKLWKDLIGEEEKGGLFPGELDFLDPENVSSVRYSQLSPNDRRGVQNLFFFPEDAGDRSAEERFARFMGTFDFIIRLVFQAKDFDPEDILWRDFLERNLNLGVFHFEMTRSVKPKRKSSGQWESWEDAWDRIEGWAQHWEKEFAAGGLTLRALASYFRHHDPARNFKTTQGLIGQPNSRYIVGVNLMGDESKDSALDAGAPIYGPISAARKKGRNLRMTMHAGELGDVRNVRDALILGSERIGHGVRLIGDPVTLEYAIRNKIPVEANIVSNLLLGAEKNVRDHTFLKYLRLGLQVSFSTDDEGMFRTDMARECFEMLRATDLTYAELRRMLMNSVRTSFLTEGEKDKLLGRMRSALSGFEKRDQWKKYRK